MDLTHGRGDVTGIRLGHGLHDEGVVTTHDHEPCLDDTRHTTFHRYRVKIPATSLIEIRTMIPRRTNRPMLWIVPWRSGEMRRRMTASASRNRTHPPSNAGMGRSWVSPMATEMIPVSHKRLINPLMAASPVIRAMPMGPVRDLSLIHISEPTRLGMISYAVFCLKK